MLNRLLAIALIGSFVAFAPTAAPASASAAATAEAPAAVPAAWQVVSSWNGGKTLACASGNGDGTSTVKVYWDGRNYPAKDMGGGTVSGAGGLAHVGAGFAISGWTYSAADKGEVARQTSLVRPSNGWVYFISGSAYGIMVEVVMPVAAVSPCPGAGIAARTDPQRQGVAAAACVTKSEFRRLRTGMTVRKVRSVVGDKGRLVSEAEYSTVRRYPRCGGGTVVVNFKKSTKVKALELASRYRR